LLRKLCARRRNSRKKPIKLRKQSPKGLADELRRRPVGIAEALGVSKSTIGTDLDGFPPLPLSNLIGHQGGDMDATTQNALVRHESGGEIALAKSRPHGLLLY
jgi:hypothetical protein